VKPGTAPIDSAGIKHHHEILHDQIPTWLPQRRVELVLEIGQEVGFFARSISIVILFTCFKLFLIRLVGTGIVFIFTADLRSLGKVVLKVKTDNKFICGHVHPRIL
jgi:hypothetical protein